MGKETERPSLREFWRRHRGWPHVRSLLGAGWRHWVVPIIELSAIAFWVMLLGREYLVMDPRIVPDGREYLSAIQTHQIWVDFQSCGTCVFWNGYERGGYPAFVDPHGSMLHPIVIVTTMLLGVINGSKLALLLALFSAGAAQWWTARILKLGWIPRMWSALVVVAGGHLAGRMELGAFGVVLSTAMASLVFPAILGVAMGGGRRYAVLLGLTVASALLAGQGYMQFGLLATLPALPFLLLKKSFKLRPIWKHMLLGGALALLLAAPFLVPLGRFYPDFAKNEDPGFATAQPLEYAPLNLVIHDPDFFRSDALDKTPFPHLNVTYIGWVPVALALIGLFASKKKHRWWVGFLATSIFLEFLVGSADLLRAGEPLFPVLGQVRHPSQIAGLAVPLIVTLAAYGLDLLLNRPWPVIQFRLASWPALKMRVFSLSWILIIPLVFSLKTTFDFAQIWLQTFRIDANIYAVLEGLKTDGLQWIEPPFGEHFFIEPAISMGLKLSPGVVTWFWKGRQPPDPVLVASRNGPPPNSTGQMEVRYGVPIYRTDALPYAYIVDGSFVSACKAEGLDGSIDVMCTSEQGGQLVVEENMWPGWQASVDGRHSALVGDTYLTVQAPPGTHDYSFRYQPWDVPFGLGLAGLGLFLSGIFWFTTKSKKLKPG